MLCRMYSPGNGGRQSFLRLGQSTTIRSHRRQVDVLARVCRSTPNGLSSECQSVNRPGDGCYYTSTEAVDPPLVVDLL
eukprot:m.82306 g.82306  ORF g.82306 m.82306 type:complete len:78 (-) comp14613_c1_seq2:840-1073(-)